MNKISTSIIITFCIILFTSCESNEISKPQVTTITQGELSTSLKNLEIENVLISYNKKISNEASFEIIFKSGKKHYLTSQTPEKITALLRQYHISYESKKNNI